VELNEFEIAHLGAGLPGHRHPVAGGLGRVGGFLEQVAAAAAGEHHGPGPQPAHLQAIENLQTLAAAPFDPDVSGPAGPGAAPAAAPLGLPLEGVHQGSAGAGPGHAGTRRWLWAASKVVLRPPLLRSNAMPSCSKRSTQAGA